MTEVPGGCNEEPEEGSKLGVRRCEFLIPRPVHAPFRTTLCYVQHVSAIILDWRPSTHIMFVMPCASCPPSLPSVRRCILSETHCHLVPYSRWFRPSEKTALAWPPAKFLQRPKRSQALQQPPPLPPLLTSVSPSSSCVRSSSPSPQLLLPLALLCLTLEQLTTSCQNAQIAQACPTYCSHPYPMQHKQLTDCRPLQTACSGTGLWCRLGKRP